MTASVRCDTVAAYVLTFCASIVLGAASVERSRTSRFELRSLDRDDFEPAKGYIMKRSKEVKATTGRGLISTEREREGCLPFPSPICRNGVTNDDASRRLGSHFIDMNAVMAEELRSISGPEREQAYEELHGVFTGPDSSAFEETSELIETSLSLLSIEIDRIPARQRRAYNRAIFLKPSIVSDRCFLLMFLRAERFHVCAAALRICRFFTEKLRLFGDSKLVSTLTLSDLSDDDITSLFNGAGHLIPQKDRTGRLIFFADYFFLDYKDWTNVNRMCWYLALTAVENDEEVQRNGIVEVFFANGALGKQTKISDYLTQGFASLLSMPIRLVGIHFCYDNYLFQPILKLTQIVFGASNRLRFRAHHGSSLELQYILRSYGVVLPIELFDRDLGFKSELTNSFLASRRRIESSNDPEICHDLVPFPSPNDILLGRGRYFQEYLGNGAMYQLIDRQLKEYLTMSKAGKSTLALGIASKIVNEKEGRFLERVDNFGWKIVKNETIIRNKITQAFRARKRNTTLVQDETGTDLGCNGPREINITKEASDEEAKKARRK